MNFLRVIPQLFLMNTWRDINDSGDWIRETVGHIPLLNDAFFNLVLQMNMDMVSFGMKFSIWVSQSLGYTALAYTGDFDSNLKILSFAVSWQIVRPSGKIWMLIGIISSIKSIFIIMKKNHQDLEAFLTLILEKYSTQLELNPYPEGIQTIQLIFIQNSKL
jgi:hypothetical protein